MQLDLDYIINDDTKYCKVILNNFHCTCTTRNIFPIPGYEPPTSILFDEEIFRLRAIRIGMGLGLVLFYINEHIFRAGAKEYLSIRNYCENRKIPIIEPEDIFWGEIQNNVKQLKDEIKDITINFIKILDRSFLLKPEYYWGMCFKYSMKLPETSPILLSTKKQKELFNENIKKFNEEFIRFSHILCDRFNIKKQYYLEFSWMMIEKIAVEYYSQQWIEQYVPKDIIFPNDLNVLIDNALKNHGLSKRKDDKYSMFIYCCMKYNLIHYDNWYDAYFMSENIIQNRVDIYSTELLEQKLKTTMEKSLLEEKYNIDYIDMMNGNEFEHFVSELFSKMGFCAEVTKQSGDQGLDVIAEKSGKKIGIQAKCYSNAVGNSAIQEAVAGMNYYRCDKAIVVTNNYFTNSAIDLANANNVVLWDRSILKEKISELF